MFSSTISGRERRLIALRTAMALVVVAAIAAALAWPGSQPAQVLELRGRVMGTTFAVAVAGAANPDDHVRVREIVETELGSIDELMSTYDELSELSRFNRHLSTEPYVVSRKMLQVLTRALAIAELTGGAFDPTVGPLVAAWGFGATDRVPAPPTPAELAAARARVGYRNLRVDETSSALAKSVPDLECDLSGIAKGYAVDRAVEALVANGYKNVLVEVGGDLRAAGRKSEGRPWQVAIERPVARRGTLQRRIALEDRALATSGDYRNFYERDGRRLSHLIDPRTGRPITNRVASASVIHPEAASADALATAMAVLGVEEGLRLAEKENLEVLFLIRADDGGIEEAASRAFATLTH